MPTFAELDAITLDELVATRATKYQRPGIIGAFKAEMDYGIDPLITAAIVAEAKRGTCGYLPAWLLEQLQQSAANFFQESYGWQTQPEWIRPVSDVLVGLKVAMDYFSEQDAPIIVPTPCYLHFLNVPRAFGRKIIEVPMLRDEQGRHIHDLDGIDAAFRKGASLLVLCNPHNPTGRVFSRTELTAISEVVARNKGRVFVDEIWAPLTYQGHQHIPYAMLSATAAGHAITATSASKGWNLPGLKCAQVIISNQEDRDRWESCNGWIAEHGAANLGVRAVTAAYESGRPWLQDIRAYLQRNFETLQELMSDLLPMVPTPNNEGTYVAWLDFTDTAIRGKVTEHFVEHAGVELTPGPQCGIVGTRCARFIFAMPRPIMIEAVRRMAAAVPSH